LGVGASTIAAPLYISEIAPPKSRGKLTALFQFNVVLGISVAVFSNQALAGIGANAWRWMLGVEAIPAFIFLCLCFLLTESPRWLIVHLHDLVAGTSVLRKVNPKASEAELSQLVGEINASVGDPSAKRGPFFTRALWKPIMLAFCVAFFNQMSGINAIWYFAKRIFMMAGANDMTALAQVSRLSLVNFIATFIGLWLIDRFGRKTLLLIGGIGYVISLSACSISFYTGHFAIAPFCLFAFMFAHAVGQGTVIWVLISEVFPNAYRAAGQALGSGTHWVMAALMTLFFPKMAEALQPGTIFAIFFGMMVLHLLWVIFLVPETKGKKLEEINL
jgi:SP family arabinose:H+ symporter-like MFS transporter